MTMPAPITSSRPRVLILDDDADVRRAHGRLAQFGGWEPVLASDGPAALELVRQGNLDAVLSDISMPGMDGLTFLRHVREYDLDVPVLLVTGEPSLRWAMEAVQLGAFRFLRKPVEIDEFTRSIGDAIAVCRAARARREALRQLDAGGQSGDRAALEICFQRALDGLWMAFQPIVRWSTKEVYAYEALLRSNEPALPNPMAVLEAAEELGQMRRLGRKVRTLAAEGFVAAPPPVRLFVNLHTTDLDDEDLLDPESLLSKIAARATLEITERASLHAVGGAREKLQKLRDTSFAIALDDLGAGYAGLSSFALIDPEVVKIDMSLVRDIHTSPVKQQLVRSVVQLCKDLARIVIAEGVETPDELAKLRELGCDLFQGYLFAKPGRPFPPISWGI